MWSGPRNISTAMMRSWENRADTFVIDEPYYAYYLSQNYLQHPCRDEVLQAGELDSGKVANGLVQDTSGSCSIYYQKHMTHHLLGSIDRDWMESVTNCSGRTADRLIYPVLFTALKFGLQFHSTNQALHLSLSLIYT